MGEVLRAPNIGADDLYVSRDAETKHILVLSVLDELVIGESPSFSDGRPYWALTDKDCTYEIHADMLTVRGKIVVPRGITIFARILRGEKGPDGEWAEFRCDGADDTTNPTPFASAAADGEAGRDCQLPHRLWPKVTHGAGINITVETPRNQDWDGQPGSVGSSGAAGADGRQGGKAGQILITYGSLQTSSLMLWACGGMGSPGGSGQAGGRGGDGGGGGYTGDGYHFGEVSYPYTCNSGRPGAGGNGGHGGTGGAGGNGGRIVVYTVYEQPDGGTIGLRTYHGRGGDGGSGGPGGEAGQWGMAQKSDFSWFRPDGDRPSGSRGPDGPRGSDGEEGSNLWRPLPSPSVLYGKADHATASYAYCSMLLERARRDYMRGDPVSNPASLNDAQLRLSWLYDVLSRFADRSQTWTEAEDILGSQLFTNVFNLLRQIRGTSDHADPLDAFGYRYDHIAFYPLNRFLKDIEQSKQWFQDLETSYHDYLAALTDKTQAQTKRQLVQDKTAGALEAHRQELKATWTELNTLASDLVDATAHMQDRKSDALIELKNVEHDLLSQTKCVGLDDMTSALQMLAFVPPIEKGEGGMSFSPAGGLMAGVEAYTLLTKDTATTSLVDGDGQTTEVKTDYLVNRVRSISGTLQSLQETYTANKAGIVDDSEKALATAQSINDMLDKLENAIGGDAAATARKATDAYVEIINHRSTAILQYNERLASIRKLSADYRDLQQRQSKLGEQLDGDADGVLRPEIVSWMSRAYEMTRSGMMRMCYGLGRSYRFTMLQEPPTDFGELLKQDPRGFNSKTVDELLMSYQQRTETDAHVPSIFPANPEDVVNGGDGGVHVLIDAKPTLERFRRTHSHIFFLSPDKDPLFSTVASPFEGMVNVRIAAVCVWLDGIALEAGQQMSISVTRDGAAGDMFVASGGDRHSFTHSPVRSQFRYSRQSGSAGANRMAAVPASLSTPAFDYTGKAFDIGDYAMPGPFGIWKIALDPDACVDTSKGDRPKLDLKEVLKNLSAIRVEFIGLSQAQT
jgi:hypothetical protein